MDWNFINIVSYCGVNVLEGVVGMKYRINCKI